MKEIFKSIYGYEGYYKVSSFGLVISERSGKAIRFDSSHKYARVSLSVGGVVKRFFVHRLVCEHFLKNPDNKPQVNHIDSNTRNNRVDNLEWCTASENSLHANQFGSGFIAQEKATKFAAEKALVNSNLKVRRLIGDRVISVFQSDSGNRLKRFVKFSCLCGNIYTKRCDSVIVNRGGICSECFKG